MAIILKETKQLPFRKTTNNPFNQDNIIEEDVYELVYYNNTPDDITRTCYIIAFLKANKDKAYADWKFVSCRPFNLVNEEK